MLLIKNLTANAKQSQTLVLPDGSKLVITLEYKASQNGWFYTEISNSKQNLTVKGMRIVNNPNALRQFKNIINFGLACYTSGNREPTNIQDFASGASQLFVLTQSEVLEYETFLMGGNP